MLLASQHPAFVTIARRSLREASHLLYTPVLVFAPVAWLVFPVACFKKARMFYFHCVNYALKHRTSAKVEQEWLEPKSLRRDPAIIVKYQPPSTFALIRLMEEIGAG